MTPVDRPPATSDALWTATERLRAVEEAAPVGIVAFDRDERVTIWNRAAEALLGWRAADVVGRPNPVIPDDRQVEFRALGARVLAGQTVSGIETCCRRKDGSQVAVSLSCAPVRDAAGAICGTMSILADITEAQRLSQQVLQAKKMEAFGQVATAVARDFNNLLTAIIGFSELVLERVGNQPDITGDIDEIKRAGERASQLTRELLAFSRKQVWVPQIVDLNQLTSRFEKMLRHVVTENIHLEIVPAPSLGRTKADPAQVEQLITNLVVNARDAMPKGGAMTIATANVALDAEFARLHTGAVAGRYVSLSVHDTGGGMTPEVLARAFEPFFTTKAPGKGSGLGLSTASGLVEQCGGFMTLDSTPGAGATVTTYWPLVVDGSREAAAVVPSPPNLRGTETILLVEDESGVRHLMGRVLERYGYTVLPAHDAEDALGIEARHTGDIHLLVSDMIMPGLSGPDLAQRIVLRRPRIQVLFVSGYSGRETIELGMSSHNASFLQKPFRPELLARTVRERLDRQIGQRARITHAPEANQS